MPNSGKTRRPIVPSCSGWCASHGWDEMTELPRITFEVAGDEVLHRGSCVPHLDGIPIAPGAIVEQRCRIDAELEGLVRPSHTVWCVCGLAAEKAIGFGTFRE